ncbi:hypothetical protein [Parasphingorhabdus sp.]|uniref:hypothetical protein n=1 Tax=Parasphingorhabdus sp. TaxID=2709688 RepID=UPI003A8DFC61
MTLPLFPTAALSHIDRSQACDLALKQAYARLEKTVDWLESQPDETSVRIHCLFARLYLYDTKYWFKTPALDENADFLKLFAARFMDGYFNQVIDVVRQGELPDAGNWSKYFKRTEKLTMRSNIFLHLIVTITALRTHICCDLPEALLAAADDYERLFGHPMQLVENRNLFFAPSNQAVFYDAILEFMEFHQTHPSLFRRTTLDFFAILVRLSRGIWWPILNGWRLSSWIGFESRIEKSAV